MRRVSTLLLLLAIQITAVATSPAPLMASTSLDTAASRQLLVETRQRLATVADLQQRGIISDEVAAAQRTHYLTAAQVVLGQVVDPARLDQLVAEAEAQPANSTWAKLKGYLSLTSIIIFAGAVAIIIAAGWLAFAYLLPILANIPIQLYEALFYLLCGGAIIGGTQLENGSFVALLGCLGLLGAIRFTCYTRRIKMSSLSFTTLVFVVWAGAAILHDSPMLGFMAIIALEACLGFTVEATGLCYAIGFHDNKGVINATCGSLVILATAVGYSIAGQQLAFMETFNTGCLFVGCFVYFLGLLIISSKYFSRENYPMRQVAVIVSGCLAIYLGSLHGVPYLRAIGGTFFFLFLVEKYVELRFITKHWAWGLLGFGCFAYGAGMFMRQHPEYFLLMG